MGHPTVLQRFVTCGSTSAVRLPVGQGPRRQAPRRVRGEHQTRVVRSVGNGFGTSLMIGHGNDFFDDARAKCKSFA